MRPCIASSDASAEELSAFLIFETPIRTLWCSLSFLIASFHGPIHLSAYKNFQNSPP